MQVDSKSPTSAKELFANLVVANAKEMEDESITREDVLELLSHDKPFQLMFKLCLEFSAEVNSLAEEKIKAQQTEIDELIKVWEDRFPDCVCHSVQQRYCPTHSECPDC